MLRCICQQRSAITRIFIRPFIMLQTSASCFVGKKIRCCRIGNFSNILIYACTLEIKKTSRNKMFICICVQEIFAGRLSRKSKFRCCVRHTHKTTLWSDTSGWRRSTCFRTMQINGFRARSRCLRRTVYKPWRDCSGFEDVWSYLWHGLDERLER